MRYCDWCDPGWRCMPMPDENTVQHPDILRLVRGCRHLRHRIRWIRKRLYLRHFCRRIAEGFRGLAPLVSLSISIIVTRCRYWSAPARTFSPPASRRRSEAQEKRKGEKYVSKNRIYENRPGSVMRSTRWRGSISAKKNWWI
jgi:hypothetical protein